MNKKMPKLKCVCGNTIGLGEIPSPNQLLVISDVEYDAYFSTELVNVEDIYSKMKIMVECKNCGRLHFFLNGIENSPIIYKRE
jgi:predicted nucleic-acid-binding Zn-ribbon protein